MEDARLQYPPTFKKIFVVAALTSNICSSIYLMRLKVGVCLNYIMLQESNGLGFQ